MLTVSFPRPAVNVIPYPTRPAVIVTVNNVTYATEKGVPVWSMNSRKRVLSAFACVTYNARVPSPIKDVGNRTSGSVGSERSIYLAGKRTTYRVIE